MNSPSRSWAILGCSATLAAAAVYGSITYAQRDAVHLSPRDIPRSLQGTKLIAANLGQTEGGASGTSSAAPSDPGDNNKIALVTERLMTQSSYLRMPADKTISNRLFDRFLNDLDSQHMLFLQSDMTEWAPMRDTIAQSIHDSGDSSFAMAAFKRYKERVTAQIAFVQDALKTKTFTFTGDDSIQIDRKDAPRPKDMDEAKQLWLTQLRYEYLSLILQKKKPAEIVTTLTKRYDRVSKLLAAEDSDEIFERYLTTFCEAFDPHSDYFGKASTDEFAIRMNASLSGIGATLQADDGGVKIEDLIPGSPAFKSNKLKIGDKIVGVGQGESGEMVDVTDMINLTKVVQMIRGEKGSTVRLLIQPIGAAPTVRKTIALVRDQVKLEDKIAKSQLVELPAAGGKSVRLGVIALPSFYGEPGSPHHTTSDIRMLIDKLKQEHVSGIILDLRGNPGGSLDEAAGCAGLFIPHGPVVQSRYASGQVDVKDDPNSGAAWTGPLVVLTSRNSASAAEIVTGALRDYGRALIVGDAHTFGKSTVQDQLTLSEIMAQANISTVGNPGSIHLTIAKYYLPSGQSVQKMGVPSDIVVPAVTDILKTGEQYLNNPLPSDKIKAADFSPMNQVQPYLAALKNKSEQRVSTSADFTYLKGEIARVQQALNKKTISLNAATVQKENSETDARIAARKKVLAARPTPKETIWPITVADTSKPGLPAPLKPGKTADAVTPSVDETDPTADTTGTTKNTGPAERDMSLDETEHILLDYIGMQKNGGMTAQKK